jgi:hypothetical protein
LLFFIDETWQKVGDQQVGALAAVGIPRRSYNAFCREIWNIKQTLGANELDECEIKGSTFFAKSAFHKREGRDGYSKLLTAAEETFAAILKYGGKVFAVWTTNEQWLLLRNPNPASLSPPYVELLRDFRRCMRRCEGSGRQGLLFFDNRGRSEDVSAACAIQNFIVRVEDGRWARYFMQTPHFTVSSVSPGLQTADLVAYLAAQQHDPTVRPELAPFWATVEGIAFKGSRSALRCFNEIPGKKKGPVEAFAP